MSLGLPGEVVGVHGTSVVIDCWGTECVVRIESPDETLLPGDFIIADEGIVVRRIPPEDVDRTMELYATVLAEA